MGWDGMGWDGTGRDSFGSYQIKAKQNYINEIELLESQCLVLQTGRIEGNLIQHKARLTCSSADSLGYAVECYRITVNIG